MPYAKVLIRTYMVCSVTLLSGMALAIFGDTLESRISPILTEIKPTPGGVRRTADKICWGWTAQKKRFNPLINLDVVLDDNGDLSFPEITDEATGRVFHSAAAKPPGPITHSVCVPVAATIKPQDPVTIHMKMHYAGFLPLWQTTATYPDVVVPPLTP